MGGTTQFSSYLSINGEKNKLINSLNKDLNYKYCICFDIETILPNASFFKIVLQNPYKYAKLKIIKFYLLLKSFLKFFLLIMEKRK